MKYLLFLLLALPANSMDLRTALSQIESGNNDNAIGEAGEVSRYQIKPMLWYRHAERRMRPTNPDDAWRVAFQLLNVRRIVFEDKHKRSATPKELYLLWNCPSRVDKPSKKALEKAERFENLVKKATL